MKRPARPTRVHRPHRPAPARIPADRDGRPAGWAARQNGTSHQPANGTRRSV